MDDDWSLAVVLPSRCGRRGVTIPHNADTLDLMGGYIANQLAREAIARSFRERQADLQRRMSISDQGTASGSRSTTRTGRRRSSSRARRSGS